MTLRILPPPHLISDQRLADFWQTARMGGDWCNITSSALSALCQELLWLRQIHGAEITALKVTLGASELIEEPKPSDPVTPLFEAGVA